MSKHHSELGQREQDLLKFRRDSDTKAAELVKMEKMLEQTKSLMEKKREPALDCTGYQENMGKDHKEKFVASHFWRVLYEGAFDRSLQWRTWRKKCAPADATGGILCITHKCWRVRWRLWKVSWWERWTICRSWGTCCGAHSRRQKSAKLQWRSWQQEWGKPSRPLTLRFQSKFFKLRKDEMATSFQKKLCEIRGWHQYTGDRKRLETLMQSFSTARYRDWSCSNTSHLSLKMVAPLKSSILQLTNKFMNWNMETPLPETTCYVEYTVYSINLV